MASYDSKFADFGIVPRHRIASAHWVTSGAGLRIILLRLLGSYRRVTSTGLARSRRILASHRVLLDPPSHRVESPRILAREALAGKNVGKKKTKKTCGG